MPRLRHIQELLTRADIVAIIGTDVALKRLGNNYFGICPFHGDDNMESDRNKSFTVSREKNFYHCFACNAHGSVINFYMKHRGVSFPTAIELVAAAAGIPPPVVGPTSSHRRRKILTSARHMIPQEYIG